MPQPNTISKNFQKDINDPKTQEYEKKIKDL
jgi:hypothetical protein